MLSLTVSRLTDCVCVYADKNVYSQLLQKLQDSFQFSNPRLGESLALFIRDFPGDVMILIFSEGLTFYTRLHDNISKLRKRVLEVVATRSREREAVQRCVHRRHQCT